MDPEPDDPRLIEAALTIADDAPATPAGAAPASMRVIAEIAGAFRRVAPARDDAPPAAESTLFIWGPLEARRAIGEGGSGEVYAAWDPALQREVALKLRRAEAGVLRWLDEARGLARVRHPNVLVVYGADLHSDRAGIWTERIRGRTLEEEIAERGPLPPLEAVRIARDLAAALDAVHRSGVVHGDVTTRNVMLEDAAPAGPRRVVLMDFGASVGIEHRPGTAVSATPLMAAPEVLKGAPSSVASDLYGLGAVLFRLLTGRHPVEGSTIEELLARHEAGAAPSVASPHPGLPSGVARLTQTLLAADPAARPRTAVAVRDPLTRALGERVRRDRRVLWLTLAASALIVVPAALVIEGYRARQDMRRFVALPSPRLPIPATPAWSTPFDAFSFDRGWSVDLGGDYDGDGFRDLVVSNSIYSREVHHRGRCEVYRGSASGLSEQPDWTWEGSQSDQSAGSVVACAGDVNGDGFGDLAEGEVGFSSRPGFVPGAVRVFGGSAHGLTSDPIMTLIGTQQESFFGTGVVAAGDVNGDGCGDLLVSERNWSGAHPNEGRVHLLLGGREGMAARPAWSAVGGRDGVRFGWGMGAAGDVNHDGFDDVLIGAPLWSVGKPERGAVFLFLGTKAGLEPAPHQMLLGADAGDNLGVDRTIAGVGDVNGDGYDDVVLGCLGHSRTAAFQGQVTLHLGGPRGLDTRSAWTAEGFGSVCALGAGLTGGADADGDGHPDLLVGGHGYTRSPDTLAVGMIALYRGNGRGFDHEPAWTVAGTQASAKLGISVTLGDADGDGRADIAVGQPHWTERTERRGRALLFRGPTLPARSVSK